MIAGEIQQGALPEFGVIRSGDVGTDRRARKRFGSAHEIFHETEPFVWVLNTEKRTLVAQTGCHVDAAKAEQRVYAQLKL